MCMPLPALPSPFSSDFVMPPDEGVGPTNIQGGALVPHENASHGYGHLSEGLAVAGLWMPRSGMMAIAGPQVLAMVYSLYTSVVFAPAIEVGRRKLGY